MIYVTGDVHGDISRFKSKALRKLKKNDYLIICGDFGFVWDGSEKEKKILKRLGKRRYHVLFVEGTHDNYSILSEYPKKDWSGGTVREISGKLLHLCRGSVFEIDGKSVFVFGGGESVDLKERANTQNWWEEELPEPEEIELARENLRRRGGRVDYIITHQPSGKIKTMMATRGGESNVLDVFFDEVRSGCKFTKWYFGCLHKDMLIPPLEVSLFEAFAEMRADCTLIGAKKKWKMR